MLDESQRLRENPHLLFLLSHYAQQGIEDRATWRDRLMQMEGVEPRQLSVHGVKIEEKAPETAEKKKFPRKKKQESDSLEVPVVATLEESPEMPQSPEKKRPSFPRKKKQKSDSPEAPAAPEESLVPAA